MSKRRTQAEIQQDRDREISHAAALKSLGDWYERDPQGFEDEHRRIYNDLVSHGYKI